MPKLKHEKSKNPLHVGRIICPFKDCSWRNSNWVSWLNHYADHIEGKIKRRK